MKNNNDYICPLWQHSPSLIRSALGSRASPGLLPKGFSSTTFSCGLHKGFSFTSASAFSDALVGIIKSSAKRVHFEHLYFWRADVAAREHSISDFTPARKLRCKHRVWRWYVRAKILFAFSMRTFILERFVLANKTMFKIYHYGTITSIYLI